MSIYGGGNDDRYLQEITNELKKHNIGDKEAIREEMVQMGVSFLSHPEVMKTPELHVRFLENKGLTVFEIQEAFNRMMTSTNLTQLPYDEDDPYNTLASDYDPIYLLPPAKYEEFIIRLHANDSSAQYIMKAFNSFISMFENGGLGASYSMEDKANMVLNQASLLVDDVVNTLYMQKYSNKSRRGKPNIRVSRHVVSECVEKYLMTRLYEYLFPPASISRLIRSSASSTIFSPLSSGSFVPSHLSSPNLTTKPRSMSNPVSIKDMTPVALPSYRINRSSSLKSTLSQEEEDLVYADEYLSIKVKCLRNFLTLRHLDITQEISENSLWVVVQQELLNMNLYKAPRDKLLCIVKACKALFSSIQLIMKNNSILRSQRRKQEKKKKKEKVNRKKDSLIDVNSNGSTSNDNTSDHNNIEDEQRDSNNRISDNNVVNGGLYEDVEGRNGEIVEDEAYQSSSSSDESGMDHISADIFLPILIYNIIKANPSNLKSNAKYIHSFRSSSKLMHESGYFLVSFMTAVAFIENLTYKKLAGITLAEYNRYMKEVPAHEESLKSYTSGFRRKKEPYTVNDHLLHACAAGDLATTRNLIESEGANLHFVKSTFPSSPVIKIGDFPLSVACRFGSTEIVKYLIAAGADVNMTNHMERTVLHLECMGHKVGSDTFHNYQVIRTLLENGADLTAVDKYGNTPQQYSQNPDVLDLLQSFSSQIPASPPSSHMHKDQTPQGSWSSPHGAMELKENNDWSVLQRKNSREPEISVESTGSQTYNITKITNTPLFKVHQVKEKDTFENIAQQYGISTLELKEANKLDNEELGEQTHLMIPVNRGKGLLPS